MNQQDSEKIKLLNSGDEHTFDEIYLNYYSGLFTYALTLINDSAAAEEILHQLFLKIWERRSPLQVHTSLKAYLYRAIHNECLNYIKHQKVKQKYAEHAIKITDYQPDAAGNLQYKQLEREVAQAINKLPEQCRTIFQLSRFEDLKYAQIAQQLGISIKTVENQMGKALKKLRLELAEYLPIILWLITYLR